MLPETVYDWEYSVYGNIQETLPHNTPPSLGKCMVLTHYVDANRYHDLVTGHSVAGILHLVNKTLVDWFSKKQATVKTATFGSKFITACTCTEQVIDLHMTLWYLGIPIKTKSYMFGDNHTVVDSSMIPHQKLHKCHTALSLHNVCEAIAFGIPGFYYLLIKENSTDIRLKHWGHQHV